MVLPIEVLRAAATGQPQAVLAWLDAAPRDINDVGPVVSPLGESEISLLGATALNVTMNPHATADHIDLARELLRRGADVVNPWSFINTIGYSANRRNDELARDLVALLLGAGADPNGHETAQILGAAHITFSGLAFAINALSKETQSGPRWGIVQALIRAGASLDRNYKYGDREETAEELMARFEHEVPNFDPHDSIGHWAACKTLVADVRAAGGTWAAYARRPRKAVMRLRGFNLRGKAPLKSGYISRDPSLEILCDARLPPEVAWHVLKFWRVTGEATGDII